MSSPELLPVILNLLVWIVGIFVKFYQFLKYIVLCKCFCNNKPNNLIEEENKDNENAGRGLIQGVHYKCIKYLPDFKVKKSNKKLVDLNLSKSSKKKVQRKQIHRHNSDSKYLLYKHNLHFTRSINNKILRPSVLKQNFKRLKHNKVSNKQEYCNKFNQELSTSQKRINKEKHQNRSQEFTEDENFPLATKTLLRHQKKDKRFHSESKLLLYSNDDLSSVSGKYK